MKIGSALIELSKDNVLSVIDPYQIYDHYLGSDLKYGKSFSSPFREDKNPSFIIKRESGYYRDFSTGESGDCFSFVKRLYGVDFYGALKQIVHDLGIADKFIITDKTFKTPKKLKVENISHRGYSDSNFNLKVKTRAFTKEDIEYWDSQGVSEKYLRLGQIYPISHYFVNGSQRLAEKFAYVFVELKDDVETYKVYQPFSKYMKWINGNDYSVWELWRLLPNTYENLIITSSRKDALGIIENLKIPATSFQAESINPKTHVVDDILARFQRVYLLYDNDYLNPDNPGQTLAQKRINEFGFINIVIPEKYKSKDFSDLVANHGRSFASELIRELMNTAEVSNPHITYQE